MKKKYLIPLTILIFLTLLTFALVSLPKTDHTDTLSSQPISTAEASSSSPDAPTFHEELFENENLSSPLPDTVSICMVGDILLHDRVETSAVTEDGSYDFTPIFSHVKEEISAFDLALVNEEVILGGEELGISGYPAFNAPYEVAPALVDCGFDVICHATNHALDKGKKGIINTLSNWEQYPDIDILGIYQTEEDSQDVCIKDVNGFRIAILNYTYGTNGISLPADMPFCVGLMEEDKVIRDIQYAEENADFTIVCPHWGTEYSLDTDSVQKKWTSLFLENGVDLVLGTHPHVIEPIEMLISDDEAHSMLVYYSIGNFVNWTSGTGEGSGRRMVGGLAEILLEKEADGSVIISDYTVEPLVCHLQEGYGGVSTYLLDDYTETMAYDNLMKLQDSAFDYEYILNLCDRVWGDLWKHELP